MGKIFRGEGKKDVMGKVGKGMEGRLSGGGRYRGNRCRGC
jgi:hypothetical protein